MCNQEFCLIILHSLQTSFLNYFSGDKFCISVLDLFGFECFAVNRLEQLVINTMNEQLQCHYNQRIFTWEMVSPV